MVNRFFTIYEIGLLEGETFYLIFLFPYWKEMRGKSS